MWLPARCVSSSNAPIQKLSMVNLEEGGSNVRSDNYSNERRWRETLPETKRRLQLWRQWMAKLGDQLQPRALQHSSSGIGRRARHTISSLSILKFQKRVQRALSIFSYFTLLYALRAVGEPVVWCFRKHSRCHRNSPGFPIPRSSYQRVLIFLCKFTAAACKFAHRRAGWSLLVEIPVCFNDLFTWLRVKEENVVGTSIMHTWKIYRLYKMRYLIVN